MSTNVRDYNFSGRWRGHRQRCERLETFSFSAYGYLRLFFPETYEVKGRVSSAGVIFQNTVWRSCPIVEHLWTGS